MERYEGQAHACKTKAVDQHLLVGADGNIDHRK